MMELGARVFHASADGLLDKGWLISPSSAAAHLDPYEVDVPGIGMHWRLRPGYRSLAQDHPEISGEIESVIGVGGKSKNVIVYINRDGFRGPELNPNHSSLRILMLGDSVTFGGKLLTYPQVVQKALAARGKDIEVINAGVEGYSTRNLLLELQRYRETAPDIVTIFIGWNDIFSWQTLANNYELYFRSIWLARIAWRAANQLTTGADGTAQSMLRRELQFSFEPADTESLNHAMASFRKKLSALVSELKSSTVSVVLFTLPGLFEKGLEPSAKALKIGHLPDYTTNTNVLASMTHQFNEQIRQLARDHEIEMIDLEQWGAENLNPREMFFEDSVHLNRSGLRRLGEFIARSIDDNFTLPCKSEINAQ